MKIVPKAFYELTAEPFSPMRDAVGQPIHGRVGYGIQSSHMSGGMCLRVVINDKVYQVLEGDYLIFSGGSLVEVMKPHEFDMKYDIVVEKHEAQ